MYIARAYSLEREKCVNECRNSTVYIDFRVVISLSLNLAAFGDRAALTHNSLRAVRFVRCVENIIVAKKFIAKMSAISLLNPKAEVARAAQALAVNISAAKGIQDVMKTNLGPKGTVKM